MQAVPSRTPEPGRLYPVGWYEPVPALCLGRGLCLPGKTARSVGVGLRAGHLAAALPHLPQCSHPTSPQAARSAPAPPTKASGEHLQTKSLCSAFQTKQNRGFTSNQLPAPWWSEATMPFPAGYDASCWSRLWRSDLGVGLGSRPGPPRGNPPHSQACWWKLRQPLPDPPFLPVSMCFCPAL